LSIFRALLRKELTETFRDRRTLLMMLGVPLLLYPAVLVLVGQLMAAGQGRLARMELPVALVGEPVQALVAAHPVPKIRWVPMSDAEARQALLSRTVEAVVESPSGLSAELLLSQTAGAGEGETLLRILFSQRQDTSVEARRRLEEVFRKMNDSALEARLAQRQLPAAFARPVRLLTEDIEPRGGLGALIASKLLPLMLVVMLFLGAFYAAIDATAGEKERGTLETLLVAPVRPMQVMAAKLVMVVAVSSMVTLLNLASLGGTMALGLHAADEGLKLKFTLSVGQVALLVAVLLPCAALVSSISLAVASLARTYREGQYLLTPLLMLGMIPPLLALMPGLTLAPWNAALPLLNLALLIKAVLLESVGAGLVVGVMVSNACVAAVGLWLAANAFRSEALRFGGVESWRELFQFKQE
jgi:sodium transport system permease protein